ncbi:MAG TPA: hypothetical protein VME86_16235 [Acidobacteriaceae bacterium]|nr:hypothetical protein [Acidobacteriaceae bacterium]
MWDRRSFCGLLLASTAAALLPETGGAQRWTPPWRLPVASSHTLRVGGASIEVDFSSGSIDLSPNDILQWVERAAQAVTIYYDRFPVGSERILVVFAPDRDGVGGGTTWGGVGGFPAFTRIHVGQHATLQDLTDDWMMTHEMVHTAFPSQADEHHWIEEGLAVYVEPVARVQAGFLHPEKIWNDMVRDMPKGDPQAGDQGLDRTHTWGRTYWGGAQFCLLADVTIRKQTGNRKGLQDALRAIVDAGGTIDTEWPLTKALTVGDKATGTTILMDQYKRMSDAPVTVDLNAIWKELGVVAVPDGGVRFDDTAPFAAVREAITRTPQAAKSPGV